MGSIIVDSETLTQNELFLLKVIFNYYRISLYYLDKIKELREC
jgi:hypothetical protein